MCSELQYQLILRLQPYVAYGATVRQAWLKPEPECSQTRMNSNFFRASLLQNGQQDFQAGLEQLAGFLDPLRTASRIFGLAQNGQQDFWACLERLVGFSGRLRTASALTGQQDIQARLERLLVFSDRLRTASALTGKQDIQACLEPGLSTTFFSVQNVSFFSVLLKNAMFFSVLYEFLATYETQKNAKNATFFCKERRRTQRMQRSFAKNVKECKNVSLFCKRTQNVPLFFQYKYTGIDIYR